MLLKFSSDEDEGVVSPYINTGTLYDLSTGRYRKAIINGKECWALDGGLSPCLAIIGRGQTYKSSIAGSLLAHAMLNYPEAEAYVYETESNVLGIERYNALADKPGTEFKKRMEFIDGTSMSVDEFYEKFKDLVALKRKHRKDYLVESPFIDPETGKKQMMWLPTIILIDSWSNVQSEKTSSLFNTTSVGDSSMNTMWYGEGNIRARIMKDISHTAKINGIYFIMTAHVGENAGMQQNPNIPPSKQLQYMRQSDKLKNVGSNFTLLTTGMLQTLKASCLQDSNKECQYPYLGGNNLEINEIQTVIQRNKNNGSGHGVTFICSQDTGVSNILTNYNSLKQNNNYGLEVKGNGSHITPILYSGVTFNRKTIRGYSYENYEFSRAMEITAQLGYIKKTWTMSFQPENVRAITIETIAEAFAKDKALADRILNSTGSWSIGKTEREFLSLRDIIDLVLPLK